MMRSAVELEESMDKHAVTPGAVIPAREMLAQMLVLNRQPKANFLAEYQKVLKLAPNRFNALYGAAASAEAAGQMQEARNYYLKVTGSCSRFSANGAESCAGKADGFVGTQLAVGSEQNRDHRFTPMIAKFAPLLKTVVPSSNSRRSYADFFSLGLFKSRLLTAVSTPCSRSGASTISQSPPSFHGPRASFRPRPLAGRVVEVLVDQPGRGRNLANRKRRLAHSFRERP